MVCPEKYFVLFTGEIRTQSQGIQKIIYEVMVEVEE
jgi:hypothetical protein